MPNRQKNRVVTNWLATAGRVTLGLSMLISTGAALADAAPNPPTVTCKTLTLDTTPIWSWTAGGGGNGIYRYKLGLTSTWSENTELTGFTPSSPLPEGEHILYVQEQDAAGNWSASGKRASIIDITPPNPPAVTGKPLTRDTTPTWTWLSGGGGGNGTYRYKLDNGNFITGGVSTGYTPPSPLGEGKHIVNVQERDAAGNWSASGMKAITIDITPPNPPAVTGETSTRDMTPTWTWLSGGGGGNGAYRYKLDNGNFITGGASTEYTPPVPLAEGKHTLDVQERDAAGNWSFRGRKVITVVNWDWEMVGTEEIYGTQDVVIKIDENDDTPYVAYRDLTISKKPTVLGFNGTTWAPVEPVGAGETFSLGLDYLVTNGVHYLTYQRKWGIGLYQTLNVMMGDAQGWSDISNGLPAHNYTKDAQNFAQGVWNGSLYLAYNLDDSEPWSKPVYVQRFDGTAWSAMPSPGDSEGFYPSYFFDSTQEETLYLAYTTENWHGDNKGTVKAFNGTTWSSVGAAELPTLNGQRATVEGLSVDGAVPYLALAVNQLNYIVMKYENGVWSQYGDPLPASSSISPFFSSISSFFVRNGIPYLFYIDGVFHKPVAKKLSGSQWVDVGRPIVSEVCVCTSLSAAMASDGTIYMAFTDDSNHYNALTVMRIME